MATLGVTAEEYITVEWTKQIFNVALSKYINEEELNKDILDKYGYKIEWSYENKQKNEQKYISIMQRFK